MKKTIVLLIAFVLVNAKLTQAQLFKKLKEKAQQAIEGKPNKSASSNNNDNGNNDTQQNNEQDVKTSNKQKTKWQPTPDCEKVFTLGEGETFMFDENKVITNNGKMSYAFIIINKKYEYFIVEDGKRSGPFKEPPTAQLNITAEKNYDEQDNDGSSNRVNEEEKIEIGNNKKDAITAQYCKTISNKLYIVFNGKNYGPYDFVAKLRVSPDKKKFWAAVTIGGANDMMTKMGMGNSFLVNEGGVKQKGGDGFPARIMVSPNFSAAALSIMDNAAQKANTISSTGKKQENSIVDMFSDNGSSMAVADNGDIISIPSQSPTQLLVNGNEAAAFAVPITSLSRLFILPNYKQSVFYNAGKIYRGDGSEEKLSGVVFPKFVTLNGVPYLYHYKIYQNDTGEKEVYLCKKELIK